MSEPIPSLDFDQSDLLEGLHRLPDAAERAPFGAIGFDGDEIVRVYNAHESQAARLPPERVVGLPVFAVVAPCMDDETVAGRFRDAARRAVALDVVIDFVLTFRMRPTKVRMRLLSDPRLPLRFVLIARR